jgi:hypothetical protein
VAPSAKIPFNPSNSSIETVRQIVFARLCADPEWHQLGSAHEFDPFVEYVLPQGYADGHPTLAVLVQEVFWLLVGEGILSPGYNACNDSLPNFHITSYGRKVLASPAPQPYDPTGYLADLRKRVATPDTTVMTYLAESLETFRKGNLVASTVMLGVAAERIFLLLCESLEPALTDTREKAAFNKVLKGFAMKPKLDWVHEKIQQVQKQRPPGFPDNATIMTVAIYDLLRRQRNELGHPQEMPPDVKRADAFVNLQIFPRYFEIAEEVRAFLKSNKV